MRQLPIRLRFSRVTDRESAPAGSEVASLYMMPDDSALFVSIQHPGQGGNLAAPTSTFPDGFARPSVVVVTRNGGGPIGA